MPVNQGFFEIINHFNDKNDIIMELFFLIDQYYQNNVEKEILTIDNTLLSLKIFCLKYGYYSIKCGLEICRQISLVPLISCDENFMANTRYLNLLLSSIIRQGQDLNQISMEFSEEELSHMILVMIRGYCFDWCKANGNYDIVHAIEQHCHILLKQISANESCLQNALKTTVPDDEFCFPIVD